MIYHNVMQYMILLNLDGDNILISYSHKIFFIAKNYCKKKLKLYCNIKECAIIPRYYIQVSISNTICFQDSST